MRDRSNVTGAGNSQLTIRLYLVDISAKNKASWMRLAIA